MPTHIDSRPARTVCTRLALILLALPAAASAAPTIQGLSVRGLQIDGATSLVVTGSGLLPEPRLLAPFPIQQQSIAEGASPDRVQFEVALPADVAPGIYEIRLATADGISNPVAVGVDRLRQLPFAEALSCLPAALSGSLTGNAILETTFTGEAGQRVVVDVEARRLGGQLSPVIRLLDAEGLQLAWSDGVASIHGDARLEFALPADGTYRIRLHDALYRGADPGFFRLKVGALHYADMVFPLGVQRGQETALELLRTSLPVGTQRTVAITAPAGKRPMSLIAVADHPSYPALSGAAPAVVVSDLEEVVECDQPNDDLQTSAVPVALNGRLSQAGEQDRYRLQVTPGAKLRLDVLAGRAGSLMDGVLTLLDEDGAELAHNDDRPGTSDPGLEFDVPEGAQSVIVSVRDLLGRGGRDYVYRIAVTLDGRADFSLSALADQVAAAAGSTAVIKVRAKRSGYQGPIRLSFPELPEGVEVSGAEIPAGATDALVTIRAGEAAPAFVLSAIVGESTDPENPIVRAATLPQTPAAAYQPWLAGQLAMGVTRPGGLRIEWADAPEANGLPRAAALERSVRVERGQSMSGAVRLRLVTSQIIPQKEVDKKNVDDLDRALRLADEPMIAAAGSEALARILVPGDLPEIPYDLAVQAELLSEDGKQVLAAATTAAVRLMPVDPVISLELDGEPAIEVATGVSPNARVTGRIARPAGFDKPVTVTLSGLPDGLTAPAIKVAGDRSEFELPLVFPYTSPLGELEGVRLVGTSQISADRKVALAGDVPLRVKIVAGGPPPGLFPLFEDEPTFVTALSEGDGRGALEAEDRYTGGAAYRVTPVQRYREKLPGLGVRIAEHPGEGEYRFLRFAWKKRGGENIVLQLHADGKWGPSAGSDGPALRYEAGPAGNPFKAAALKVSDSLPEEWTVVTRDLFVDFGSFQLDGLALTASDGDDALFDHIYLARTRGDLDRCPRPESATPPLVVFEDEAEFAAALNQGGGQAAIVVDDKYSGTGSIQVTPDQRYSPSLAGLGVKIRENPGPGEYRYLRFAWRKQGGQIICLQVNHDGLWGPSADNAGKFRYDAGPRPGESYGAALRISEQLPQEWTVVTRDLFADFGEFTFTGLALSPQDGEYARFDHIYLSASEEGFQQVAP